MSLSRSLITLCTHFFLFTCRQQRKNWATLECKWPSNLSKPNLPLLASLGGMELVFTTTVPKKQLTWCSQERWWGMERHGPACAGTPPPNCPSVCHRWLWPEWEMAHSAESFHSQLPPAATSGLLFHTHTHTHTHTELWKFRELTLKFSHTRTVVLLYDFTFYALALNEIEIIVPLEDSRLESSHEPL